MRNRVKFAIAATVALTLGLAAFAAFYILASPSPSLSESELKAIARAWAEDNMDGAAGDELIEFVVANTTVNSRSSFRLYLKAHMDSGATWTYGPFASADRGSYEASATVALKLGDIMPTVFSDEAPAGHQAHGWPVEPGDFRNDFALTFLLTVDPASQSVTEWRVHDAKAVYVRFPPPA